MGVFIESSRTARRAATGPVSSDADNPWPPGALSPVAGRWRSPRSSASGWFHSGAAALGYGIIAVALGVMRRAPVIGLDALGWGLGELSTLLALGPVAALAGFASQAGTGSSGAFLAGLPAGVIAAAVLFARHFTEHDADSRLARVTPVVALGEDQARLVLVACPLVAAAAVVVAARTGEYGPWAQAAVAAFAGAPSGGAGTGRLRPVAASDARLRRGGPRLHRRFTPDRVPRLISTPRRHV